jgi:hypothetical protein
MAEPTDTQTSLSPSDFDGGSPTMIGGKRRRSKSGKSRRAKHCGSKRKFGSVKFGGSRRKSGRKTGRKVRKAKKSGSKSRK